MRVLISVLDACALFTRLLPPRLRVLCACLVCGYGIGILKSCTYRVCCEDNEVSVKSTTNQGRYRSNQVRYRSNQVRYRHEYN
jgi:hypothetical protein